jgi:hypothetical protein
MAVRHFNNTTTVGQLTLPVGPSDTVFVVSDFTFYPTAPFTATVERNGPAEEIVLVTAVNLPNLTVTRGYDGTAAQTHLAGSAVEHTAGALEFTEANDHVNATQNIHGTTGELVGAEGAQTIFDKTLVSPVLQADVTDGDAFVAVIPSGAGSRNLGRGVGTDGLDKWIVSSAGVETIKGLNVQGNADVDGTLNVDGATTTHGLTNTGNMSTSGTLGAGATTVTTLHATGAATLDSSLAVTGASTLTGAAALNGGASVPTTKRVTLTDQPTSGTDAVNKTYADALGTSAATASTIARRDASGRLQVATPSAGSDAANKTYVDNSFTDTGWQSITAASGFSVGSGGFEARKINGIVYLRCHVTKDSGTIAINDTVGTLPANCRPSKAYWLIGSASGPVAELQVAATTGVLKLVPNQTITACNTSGSFPID